MILTRTDLGRHFVGRLDAGSELVSTLEDACRQHRIACGEVRGSGYLRKARIVRYDAITRETSVPEAHIQGPLTIAAAQGTASQHAGDTVVHLHAVLVDGAGRTWAGRLADAEVIAFEFVATSFDDIVLIRNEDRATGLPQWLQLRAPDDPHGHHGAPPETLVDDAQDETGAEEPEEVSTSPGDILEHPRFGRCVVVNQPDFERVTVRLENQRTVDLHLGLVRLTAVRKEGPATVYKARILRKH